MERIRIIFLLIVFSLSVLVSCSSGISRTTDPPQTEVTEVTEHTSKTEAHSSENVTEDSSEEVSDTSEELSESPEEPSESPETETTPETTPEATAESYIQPEGTDLESRFAVPEGYVRTACPEGSFGSFVRRYPLKPDGSPVLLWDGNPKGNQKDHCAVFAMHVEDELDVQQCADSVMRIYAEYFRATWQYDRIRFHFVSGFLCDYNNYIAGNRVKIDGSDVSWVLSQPAEDSDRVFNEYIKIVSAYASTLSMVGESVPTDLHDLQIGDIFLKGGSPGHVVMVADICEKEGKKAFLLAQGYMPAQEFHIIKNPLHENDPWYYEEEVQYPFRTQEYTFSEGALRRPMY